MKKLALYKQIQEHIMQKIQSGQLRPADRIASEQELMDEFKVSKITVKNALTSLADEGVITRIQGKGSFVAADFKINSATQPSSISESAPLVGFIIPILKTSVIQNLVDYVEYYLKEAGYHMILRITRESAAEESLIISELTKVGVRGLIVFPTEDEKYNESLLRLSLDKFPFVFIDRYLRNIATYTITSDNHGGAYNAVSYLLNSGHQQIALISPENSNTAIEDRTAGFEKAYIDSGISIDKNLWCHVPLDILRSNHALGYVTDFLKEHKTITSTFALTEEVAKLTSKALKNLNRHEQVQMLAFDDPGIPGIPYVLQDEQQIAHSAVALLCEQIQHDYLPRQVIVPVKLVLP